MRKMAVVLLVMVMLLALGACEKPDNDKTHDELIAEMGERGRAYHEKRQAFLNSELYEAAFAYVQDTLDELLPGCEADIQLEPGSLIGNDLSEFSDFSDSEDVRLSFFSSAKLYVSVNFWDFDADGFELAKDLAARQISGEMAADEYGADIYRIDAENRKVEWIPEPGV